MIYQPLLPAEGKAEYLQEEEALPLSRHEADTYARASSQRLQRWRETYALALSLLLNLVLIYGCTMLYQQKEAINPNVFWTPFNARLRYHAEVFTSGFGHSVSAWQGNASAAKDTVWEASYVEAFTVSKAEAARLANKTVPATRDAEGGYVTSFSVFHYLHCLDMVRQVTEHVYFPAYYQLNATHNLCQNRERIRGFEPHGMFSHEHIDHCIDTLRQALRCQPDLGPVVWQWVDRRPAEEADAVPKTRKQKQEQTQTQSNPDRKLAIFAETVHSCANFDDVLQYARDRRFDAQVYGDTELPALGRCGYEDENCRS